MTPLKPARENSRNISVIISERLDLLKVPESDIDDITFVQSDPVYSFKHNMYQSKETYLIVSMSSLWPSKKVTSI